jgi:hypothetical protein
MTVTEKNDMFAKEYLGIEDIAKLYGLCYNRASMLLREIKNKITIGQGKELRVTLRGKIHTQDYLDWRNSQEVGA